MRTLFSIAAAAALVATSSVSLACNTCGCKDAKHDESVAHKHDIVDTAVEAEGFGTLVAAVKAGGLVDTLKGDGPFTVFAPTDEAFAKLPADTLASLLKPENKDQLVAILTYHVVPGKVMAADVSAGDVETVNGKKATIAVNGETVTIAGSQIVATDIECTNGVIHVIDTVMLP